MKASARAILMDIPDYARGTQELWTAKSVKVVLVDSYRMLKRVGGRVGPAGMKAAWPDYQVEAGDFVQQSLNKTLKTPKIAATYSSDMTVTRMEMVLCGWTDEGTDHPAWMAGNLLAVPDLRDKLLAWIRAEVRGESFSDLCRRKHWALATAKRLRDRAAFMIADRLNRAGVVPWLAN